MLNRKILFLAAGIISASADTISIYPKSAYSINIENDAFVNVHSDKYYTSGVALNYTTREFDLSSTFWRYLSAKQDDLRYSRFNVGIAHFIHTPINCASAEYQEFKKENPNDSCNPTSPLLDPLKSPKNQKNAKGDYPYSGAILLHAGISNRTESSHETLRFSVGIIGSGALGGEVQNGVHKLLPNSQLKFSGWDTQIETELLLNVHYEYLKKFTLLKQGDFSIDYLGGPKISLGNAQTLFGTTQMLRAGINLDSDYGIENLKQNSFGSKIFSEDLSLYAFFNSRYMYVARNIFIEGNSFNPKHFLSLNRFVITPTIGFNASYRFMRFYYAWTFVPREFQEQRKFGNYGSIGLDLSF
ncbi:MAG: lipid A deacylase LpxR family protein [Helicobacter sp.]|nr:lipid A deacylase LpxR family protein [Helicobacter sp.]